MWARSEHGEAGRGGGIANGVAPIVEGGRRQLVGGAQVPFQLAQVQGTHRIQQTLTSHTFETVPPEKFSPPPSR